MPFWRMDLLNRFMAIRIFRTTQIESVQLVSGRFYLFNYAHFRIDPTPLILYMNSHYGVHPNTGHLHHYIQGINIHYLPKNIRWYFIQRWFKVNVNESFARKNFTKFYSEFKKKFPNINFQVRRYFYRPANYINRMVHMDQALLKAYFENPVNIWKLEKNVRESVILAWKARQLDVSF